MPPPGAAAAAGAVGRRTGLIYLRSQSPGGAASRGCCGSRCAPAARSAPAGSRPPSKTHTHTHTPRVSAQPRAALRGRGMGTGLPRGRMVPRGVFGPSGGKIRPRLHRRLERTRGAAPLLSRAPRRGWAPCCRARCPPEPRRFSPSPPRPLGAHPQSRPPKFARTG